MGVRTGVPLNQNKLPSRIQEGVRVLIDKNSTSKLSAVFEVTNTPLILRAYTMTESQFVRVLSIFGQYTQPFMLDGESIFVSNTTNTVILATAGRYRVELVGDFGPTITLQEDTTDAKANISQPSGVQANRPNLFFNGTLSTNTSHIIEIQDKAWVFNAFGLQPSEFITVWSTYGFEATYKEEPYLLDGETQYLSETNNAIVIKESGRYRFKLNGDPSNIILVGNPTQVESDGGSSQGPPGPPGPPGPDNEIISLLTGEIIPGQRAVVSIADAVFLFDPDNSAHVGAVVGISTESVTTIGTAIRVRVAGKMADSGWSWADGTVYATANGQLQLIPPSTGTLQEVGTVLNNTNIVVDIEPPIVRI